MVTINGTHVASPPETSIPPAPPDPPQATQFRAVRVYRVESFDPVFVRMLSADYKGLFTHYYQKRSHYCCGDGCRVANHAADRTWKGYVPAEILVPGKRAMWMPICLEITENLELDLRGVFERGQLWELYKLDGGKGKKSPVTGKLHADPPPATLRRPFDVLPCLRALYHRDVIDLRHPSPLPPRVFADEVEGELPEVLRPKPANRAAVMDDPAYSFAEEHKQRFKAYAQNKQSPSDRKREQG